MKKIILWVFFVCLSFPLQGRCDSSFSPDRREKAHEIPPQVMVIFGATGDLTKRKLVPALVRLFQKGKLPQEFTCIGIGLGVEDLAQFRKKISTFLTENQQEDWKQFSTKFFFIPGHVEQDETFHLLKQQLQKYQGEKLFYLATPPFCFLTAIDQLHKHQLLVEENGTVRVVIEKPFGIDLTSAKKLQKKISSCLKESQVFRMDHFLGKEIIRQLLHLRFSNPLIETIWNRNHIDRVFITVSENMGIEDRGLFWEQTGFLRDVVQNHMMQLISLIGMERPKDFSPDSLQKEKCRLMEAVRPIPFDQVNSFITRGQYKQGFIDGKLVKGYREEVAIPLDSTVETSIAGKFFIDNERWKGVPFYLKGGKRLSENLSQVSVVFKAADGCDLSNELVFQTRPTEEIVLHIHAQDSEAKNQLHKLQFPLKDIDSSSLGAYEVLLNEVMQGDNSHFASYEEIAKSWELFTPVFQYWEKFPSKDLVEYEAGSKGPDFP